MSPTPADYEFWGFLCREFPLGNPQNTMCLLHQRTISKGLVTESDIRARVYYNLVVFFRLLWHHRTLEPAPKFWKYIWQDFPVQATKSQDLEKLMAFYVSARETFRQRHQESSYTGSFLAALIDQWRSRPMIRRDAASHISDPNMAGEYSKLRESWDAARRGSYSELARSEELNWPVFASSSQNKSNGAGTMSKGNAISHQRTVGIDELIRPKPATATDLKQEDRLNLPSGSWKKKSQASSIKISLPTGEFTKEPGRLTPPAELQALRNGKTSGAGRPPANGKSTSTKSATEAEPSIPGTPPKRPPPLSDELSPFSKRRCMSRMEPMLATSSQNPAPQPGKALPSSNGRCMAQMANGKADSNGTWCSAFAQAPISEQQNGGAKVQLLNGSNILKPSIEGQSLEEMIASAAGSPRLGHRSSNVLPSSPGVANDFKLSERDAPMAAAPNGFVPPPVAPIQGNSLVVIDMPATLFAFSRKIESLEKMAKEQAGVRGFIAALSRDVGTLTKTVRAQAEAHNIASTLSQRVTDLEKMVQGRANVSATVASSVSALTWTMECLEKKLGEATHTQNTIADLEHRIVGLEKMVGEGDVTEACKLPSLEPTADSQPKVLEDGEIESARGGNEIEAGKVTVLELTIGSQPRELEEGEIENAGEIVEYREPQPVIDTSSP